VDVIEFIAGALISALIGLFLSWWGTKQMRDEVEKLRKLNVLTIRILDEANLLPPGTKTTKDEAGNYTGGFTHELSAALEGKATLEAAAVVREDDTDTPEQEDPSEEKGPRQE
jgi:hypothetical protein